MFELKKMKFLLTSKALALFSICVVFVIDLAVPLGTAVAVFYSVPIALASNENKKTIINISILCIILTILDVFWGTYPIAEFFYIDLTLTQSVIANRFFTMAGIISLAMISIKYQQIREERAISEMLHEQRITNGIVKAQEEIQYRIGAELHDNVCQILAISKMTIGLIKKRTNPSCFESCGELLTQTEENVTAAITEIRDLTHHLAPVFFNKSLRESLTMLLNGINRENRYLISADIDSSISNDHISIDAHLNLFRILQEQLNNIVKHSQATNIQLKVELDKDNLTMIIIDNGVGFDVELEKGGIGITNMKRRANILHGKLEVESSHGKGCTISVKIPLTAA